MVEARFSIDDGSKKDLIIADLLDKYNFKGVFYIAPFYSKYDIMNVREINELSKRHEIGGHTLNHCLLTKVNKKKGKKELLYGKTELEEYISKPIEKFAYPRGYHNDRVIEWVKEVGFKEGRTMKQGCVDVKGITDNYAVPITVHFHPYYLQNWKAYYEEAKKRESGYFHVTCHGHEVAKYNLWDEYEKMLKFIYEDTDTAKDKN